MKIILEGRKLAPFRGIKLNLFSNMLIKFSLPADECKFQEISKSILSLILKAQFPISPLPIIMQVSNEYKTGLPDVLLSFVDSIIKIDASQIMRYNFLHYTIDDLLRQDVPREDSLWIFIDHLGEDHIFIENIKSQSHAFAFRSAQTFVQNKWDDISNEDFLALSYAAHPMLTKILSPAQLQKLCSLRIVSMDQIRLKCLANVYFQPGELITDIKGVLAWNQLFRAKSANSFLYLSQLFDQLIQIINKRKFHKKFATTRQKDFQRLLNFEFLFKAQCSVWPFIPQKFRQYEEIDEYVPTPKERENCIKERIKTKKTPVECPEDCVCLDSDEKNEREFCKYTLMDGWVSECPNRTNKIECNHEDPEKMARCRNAEIRKGERRKCKKEEGDTNPENQIEECIIWGIDLFTRTLIYHSMPEVDISFPECLENKSKKSQFIEQTFLKAINFNGKEGYKFDKACTFIIDNSDNSETLSAVGQQTNQKQTWSSQHFMKWYFEQEKSEEKIFSGRDRFYAEVLLKNYLYCMEKFDNTLYRIHTKGKGARCINKNGIKRGRFIVEYFGELYEPWRWYEREDFIKKMINNKKMKNFIPEFYNIYLETHVDDPEGYDLMVVDPIKKGNFSSRFSHSCNPNCGTVATISQGKYHIGMYSFKDIKYGEELTFDYCCVTESKNEHENSICLCGTQKCRGYYLQFANSKNYNQLIDKHNCFHTRNSFILQALDPVTEEDIQLCSKHNIKDRMIGDTPKWIIKWVSCLLRYMEYEGEVFKNEVKEQLQNPQIYRFEANEEREEKIEAIAKTGKQQLLNLRIQNLFTTINKLKYYLNSIQDTKPPLHHLEQGDLLEHMVTNKGSILKEVQDIFIEKLLEEPAKLIEKFIEWINLTVDLKRKLFLFRLCCLCIGHMCLYVKPTDNFNSHLMGDIIFFYAFTHTYFTSHEYKSHVSEEIKVALQEVTGNPSDKSSDKTKKRYSSQCVWGQLVFWYKQTIVNPEASLSQDRRGTLSYPTIKTCKDGSYPYEKHSRKNFFKVLREKPASSWPSSQNQNRALSFKNESKCYGTIFFESVHSAEKLKDLGTEANLIDSVLNVINSPFCEKIALFKHVESLIEGIGELDEGYDVMNHVLSKYIQLNDPLPEDMVQEFKEKQPTKKKKVSQKSSRIVPTITPNLIEGIIGQDPLLMRNIN